MGSRDVSGELLETLLRGFSSSLGAFGSLLGSILGPKSSSLQLSIEKVCEGLFHSKKYAQRLIFSEVFWIHILVFASLHLKNMW